MELERGSLSRRGFLDRSLAALTVGGLPLWYAREVLADEEERDVAARKGQEGRAQRSDRDGGHRRRRPGHRHHEGRQEQAGRQVRRRLRPRRRATRKKAAKEVGKDCHDYKDFRELLAKENLDAVTIGTVDHWHALTSIAAMKAGCDVYCEKPLSLTIEEGKAMVKAARKYDRVFQTGSQQRSDARYRLACELVRNGRIGKVHTVEARIGDNPIGGPFKTSPGPRGARLGLLERPDGRRPLRQGKMSLRVPLVVRVHRRQADRLGRPPQRHRPVGPGHGRLRPGERHRHGRRRRRTSPTATTATPTSP